MRRRERRRASRRGAVALVVLLAACRSVERPRPVPTLRLIVSEAWNGGTRLVLVDEHGDRWAVLTAGRADGVSRDEQAAVSPDGRWVAFVSSRGRTIDATSLWVMPAAVGATATRVTDGTGDDVDPTWTADGAVVFARRTGARFGLARVAIGGTAGALAIGPVELLTTGAGHHLAPSVGDDGEIAYQEVDPARGESRIAVRAPDGSVAFATDGPLDVTPAWRPGTRTLVFARGVDRADGTRDLDLWWHDDDDASGARPVVELPGTDDSGPRWSRDGRWLFATAVAHDEDGALPSVVYLDAAEPAPTPRMLRDAVGAIARQGPAPMPVALDPEVLGRGPPFAAALATALDERATLRAEAAAVDAGVDDAGL